MKRSMRIAAGLALAVVAVQALLVPVFAAPATHIAPHDVPVAVAGPAQATAAITAKLQQEEGAFKVVTTDDPDGLIKTREVYAAIVATPAGVELHTAAADSPAVAALLTADAQQLGGGQPIKVVSVVGLPADDPRGTGFVAGYLPIILTGMIAGILLVVLVARPRARLLGSLAYALGSGLIGALVLRDWLGVLSGPYLADAAAVGLVGLAVSATVAGLGSVLGPPGLGLGVLTVFLVGNPLSAVSAAPELLPTPWGAVGQDLPAGAGATLLRSVGFFNGAGGANAASVLGAYVLGGLILMLMARGGPRTGTPATAELQLRDDVVDARGERLDIRGIHRRVQSDA